jgi:hypothetical protein
MQLSARAPAFGVGEGPQLSPLDVAAGPSPTPNAGFVVQGNRASIEPALNGRSTPCLDGSGDLFLCEGIAKCLLD